MDAVTPFQALTDRGRAACRTHGAAGCAALPGENGEVRAPFAPPATGRDAIAATRGHRFARGETNGVTTVTGAASDGDIGFRRVHFEADVPGADRAAERFRGTSFDVQVRRSDGIWTIRLTSPNELVKQGTDQDT